VVAQIGVNADSIVLIGVVLALVMALVKLTKHLALQQSLPVIAKWIDDLSVERYRPMLRLLDQADLDFLRTQPGFTTQLETAFRIQRCQLFHEYLRQLETDFKRICMALTVLIVHSRNDRPDLAFVLVRSRMAFAYGMFLAQIQLVFYRYRVGAVEFSGLVNLIDGMLELGALVPALS
jgi:hypothetical protein